MVYNYQCIIAVFWSVSYNRIMASTKFLEEYIKQHSSTESGVEDEENSYGTILKDLVILAGTVFTTSIALAAGRDVNIYFVTGELLMLISIIAGLILMYHEHNRRIKIHTMYLKNDFEDFLEIKKGRLDASEKTFIENEIKILNKQFQKNELFDQILKLIPISLLPKIFFIFLLFGIMIIWYSLMK